MSDKWYTRPLIFVSDIERSVDFYLKQLGFEENWRYDEAGKTWIAQVSRKGCELILTSQWPAKAGSGIIFISLDPDVLKATRAEYEGRGVKVEDGEWGYQLMIIRDPDGNQLWFPYEAAESKRMHKNF
jgi:catechol 2,3-dioxygenase-like lactoylglutathione lyase family enzyme